MSIIANSNSNGSVALSMLKSCTSFIGAKVANLGVSIAILRMAVHALKHYYLPKLAQIQKQAEDEYNTDLNEIKRYEYFTLLLRLALGNLLFQSSSSSEYNGDAYYNALYGTQENKGQKSLRELIPSISQHKKDAVSKKDRQIVHRGSCHCNTIQFRLRAKPDFEAIDCPGKIRYPHIVVESSAFKITRGSKFLQMYYVDVSKEDFPQDINGFLNVSDDTNARESTTAAHAFCMR